MVSCRDEMVRAPLVRAPAEMENVPAVKSLRAKKKMGANAAI